MSAYWLLHLPGGVSAVLTVTDLGYALRSTDLAFSSMEYAVLEGSGETAPGVEVLFNHALHALFARYRFVHYEPFLSVPTVAQLKALNVQVCPVVFEVEAPKTLADVREAVERLLGDSECTRAQFDLVLGWVGEVMAPMLEHMQQAGEIPLRDVDRVGRALLCLGAVSFVGLPPEGFSVKEYVEVLPQGLLAQLVEAEGPLQGIFQAELWKRAGRLVEWTLERLNSRHGNLRLSPVHPADYVVLRFQLEPPEKG